MGAQYNTDEVERLVREAREDDARMTPAPWETSEPSEYIICEQGAIGDTYCGRTEDIANAIGIARTRNNLRAMADQLEAARAEVERLGALNAVLAKQSRELDTVLVERIAELEAKIESMEQSAIEIEASEYE